MRQVAEGFRFALFHMLPDPVKRYNCIIYRIADDRQHGSNESNINLKPCQAEDGNDEKRVIQQ